MDATALAESARNDANPPVGLTPTELTLWLARAGKWDAAHDACQDLSEPAGAWIHAYLHREEGDYGNACYWYTRARKPAPSRNAPLEAEWMEIACALCV
ncbi:hypothetical protein OKA05_26390 [Luteolibacter arcticus]|uniref:Uncharacterized protein n=1 Tax=Luteolibacter arcticus TaxID=1581411 RepID=A0ABT3GRG0_9BACT|nr:hypothetical protein [Luteolibacter arcticus]MCW1926116.1 hypothetical protein [Luteolibacter arcticus]